MAIELIDGCKQIEMVVHDVTGAVEFMRRTLGAERIEQQLVDRIGGHVLHIDHVDCGQAMFQFCSVITDDQPHRRYIDRYGPMLTNLNFSVRDQQETDRVIAVEGGRTLISFPMANIGWEDLLEPDNVRPRDEMGEGIFADTHELIGFDFEYCEPAGPASPWHVYLQNYEQGITTAIFAVPALETTIAAIDRADLVRTSAQYIDSREPVTLALRLNSKHLLGFDIELFETGT